MDMATNSTILTWRIPWTQRISHITLSFSFTYSQLIRRLDSFPLNQLSSIEPLTFICSPIDLSAIP